MEFTWYSFTKEELHAEPGFNNAVGRCGHTFDHPDNFAFHEGKVLILDYGEDGFLDLIQQYEDRLEALLLAQVKK